MILLATPTREVKVNGERLSVCPAHVGIESIDVDVQEPECTAFRTLPIPATLLFEILRCFGEQTLRNSEASGELGVVFIDDDRDLPGEIGDAVSTVSFVK